MAILVFGLMATLAAAGLAVFDIASGAWPDPGLAICLAAAIVAKKDGDLTLALVAGLGAGLFSVGPWGAKAIAFLVGVSLIGVARRSSRLDQDLSRLANVRSVTNVTKKTWQEVDAAGHESQRKEIDRSVAKKE